MHKSFMFSLVLERYELPDAQKLSDGPLSDVAAACRTRLEEAARALSGNLCLSVAEASEYVAAALDLDDWAECERLLQTLEQDRLISPEEADRLLSILIVWPGEGPAGELAKARLARRELVSHVVLGHVHGHSLAKRAGLSLPECLDLAALVHGAPDWKSFVYDAPAWMPA